MIECSCFDKEGSKAHRGVLKGFSLVILLVCSYWTFFWFGGNFQLVENTKGKQKAVPVSNESSFVFPHGEAPLVVGAENPCNSETNDSRRTFTAVDDDRVIFDIGVEHLFWKGKNKICELVQNVTNVKALGKDEPRYVEQGKLPPLLNLTLRCEELTSSMGNWITALYHARLVAAVGLVDFQFQCSTGMQLAEESVLPWLTGNFQAPSPQQDWPYDFGWPDPGRSCTQIYAKLPLHHLAHEMQRDMRRIAIAMLGQRGYELEDDSMQKLESLRQQLQQRLTTEQESIAYPLLDMPLDDAAIHFRCGDVFGGTTKDVYGLIKFREYVQRIPRETTRTIGIHTQSFNASLLRGADRTHARDCDKLVHILVDYLQASYPTATINIRNSKDDTIPLTYARMIMAEQTMTTMSTFGIFPVIGTFGEGYFQKSGRQNKFAHLITETLPSFHAMEGPILSSPKISKSSWHDIIEFVTG